MPDNPIESEKEDLIGRKYDADVAVGKLLQTKTDKSSFSFGIIAPWGTGKSSFMNMMKNHISNSEDFKEDTIILDFNPWKYSGGNSLSQEFFELLENTIGENNDDLFKSIRLYSRDLHNTGNIYAILFHNILNRNETIESRFRSVYTQMSKLQKRIVVFIDDIDRLNSEEIQEVFKLVRNTSNFPHMYFILAFDKTYVWNSLQPAFAKQSVFYTEKILQEEIPLIPLTEEQIRDILKNKLKKVFDIGDYQKAIDFIDHKNIGYSIQFSEYIKSFRSINRLLNTLILSYPKLKGEVEISDFLAFEIFRLSYPQVTEFFIKYYRQILSVEYGVYHLNDNSTSSATKKDNVFFDNREPIDIIDYLKKHREGLYIEDTDIEKVNNILQYLFGKYRPRSLKSINNSQYTHKYLYNALLDSDLSEKDFDLAMRDTFDNLKGKIQVWSKQKKCYSFARRLLSYENTNKEYLQKVIRTMFYLGSINEGVFNSSEELNRAIYDLRCYNKTKDFIEEDKQFVREALTENGYNEFITYFFYYLFSSRYHWDFVLENECIINIQIEMFINYVESSQHSLTKILHAWYNLRHIEHVNVGNNSYTDKIIAPKESTDRLRQVIEKNIESFIPHTIQKHPSLELYCATDCVKDIYGSEKLFLEIINKFEETPELKEYKEFLGKIVQLGSNEFIEFKFEKNQI